MQAAVFHLRHQEVHRHGVLLQRLGESPQPFQRPRLRKGFREVVCRGVKPAINARAAAEVLDLAVDPAGVEERARRVPEERPWPQKDFVVKTSVGLKDNKPMKTRLSLLSAGA